MSAFEQVTIERVAFDYLKETKEGIEQVEFAVVMILTTVILGIVCETPLN